MPPRIEAIIFPPPTAERQDLKTKYFVINLQEEVETFDLNLFHKQVKTVGSIPSKFSGQVEVKYIVVSDRMFIFAREIMHNSFHDFLARSGVSGELQSAGNIEINFALSRPGLKSGRKIRGYSFSLRHEPHFLSVEESDQYKKTTIRRVLGKFFQVL